LYESALQYVGWPIVPGFDFAGVVEWAGADTEFVEGDEVFGFTMFGAYSNHILVPASQIRKKPTNLSLEISAALPAVAATALHALSLAGGYPGPLVTRNKAALIHSAAGGVGSMLIQMCKLQGFSPVVAVVGSKHKISFCKELGADHVIDKSSQDLWVVAKLISPNG
jgi:NADPH:quinone reductase-like Zn-dependent oxidoreductase